MDVKEQEKAPRRPQPLMRRVAMGAGLAVFAAAIAGGAYALLKDEAAEAVVGGEPIGGDPMAMCIQYTDEMLLDQEYAFDGTLISATGDGGDVVFEVHRWYKGGEGAQVILDAQGMLNPESIALVGATLEVGQRYLVSGQGGFVWACGYTLTYDTALADQWAELFGA